MFRLFPRNFGIAAFCFFIAGSLFAQDPHYTQFYSNQQMLNPAFSGAAGGPRVAMNYRAQWVAIPGAYRQFAFGYDQPFYFGESVQGGGILLHRDQAGEGNLTKLDMLLNYSFAVQMGGYKNKHYLRFGLSGGVQQASIDFYRLRFGDMIDPELGFIKATNEPPIQTRLQPDVNFGVAWYNKTAWVSFAVNHLTQPDQSWPGLGGSGGGDSKLPMRISAVTGAVFNAGPIHAKDAIKVSPSIQYMKQKNFNQLALGFYTLLDPVVFGVWYRSNFNNFNNQTIQSDMVAGLVGFKEGIFSVGYSYDYTISMLGNGISGGSHEIALVLEFESEKQKTFIHRRLTCPRF